MRYCLPLLLLMLCAPISAQQSMFAELDQYLKQEVDKRQMAGSVALIIKDGKEELHESYGYSNLEEESMMKKDHIFHIMSMTKPIVTVAFMMLYEEGHFELDDPVAKYLPEFSDLRVSLDPNKGADGPTEAAASPVTIAQVMSHTAGFSHGLGGTTLDNEIARNLYYSPQKDIADRVKTLASLPLVYQPGTRWYYSASPDILARLIEVFSEQTVEEFLQERIFTPLSMNDTGYNLSEEQAKRFVALHRFDDKGKLMRDVTQMPPSGHTVFGGTHGLLSTASDYAKFCRMLLNKGSLNGQQFLKPETLDLMTSNQLGDIPYQKGMGFGYGFGLRTTDPEDGTDSAGRYYWSGAYCTFFFVDPQNDLIAILMTQSNPYSGKYGDQLRKHVYRALGSRK
ncbi:serine hydrolase [Lewinella sp. W8]|uniref:serine hydrolase domain-containing protein n=1 Tax=Lewinella sp. W8 TaxID=2528208 RepID=UPI001067DE19|nr:serine hydrolase domain-containing protein [Lewinella sp. W8]MTB53246.1 serine hydrolase [Lewinella sp. W8]